MIFPNIQALEYEGNAPIRQAFRLIIALNSVLSSHVVSLDVEQK